ncbi:DUF1799 domain-containing protein [Shumkonia mesophila]|uniref:DUF1799 domain-containing protein n=1 Tax=Shumkonia mesophila TaxID=2838854 RepID=UPI002935196F|nr:DUF1799 domain-containing protein [Shumkonia mesophila]
MARRWAAGGAAGADEAAEDLSAFGAPPEIRERCEANDPSEEIIGVLPEGMDAAMLFMALATQWTFAGMDGQPTGLVYASIEPTARMGGIALTPAVFAGLRIMEAAAIAAWRERRAE